MMLFRTRKMISARDLNSNGTLFGGRVLAWIDEEAFIFATCQIGSEKLVTKLISRVEFVSTARIGDIVEIGTELISLGTTSLTLSCVVRNKKTTKVITQVSELVFVHVDEDGVPSPHGITKPIDDVVSSGRGFTA
ncbi:acyl-CoA thioesterase [Porticoccus sp. Uisw_050_02]|jgi:acyl-CoA thioesterase YciA|uniref:acyl-CoA thioesterase n=1 Tax=Porticoccus sp. Uisw_050_02 TaxID=3230978 RepID=UPI0039E7FAC3